MALKITSTDEKPLLARKEIKGELSFPEKATPSNDEVGKAIASQLKVNEKTVVVKHIYTAFGSSDAKVEAYVYNTDEDLKKIEPRVKKTEEKKQAPAEEKPAEKKEEAKEEPPKEEKPAEKKEEAPKEEAKPEEKK